MGRRTILKRNQSWCTKMKISNLREHDENNPIFKGQKCNLVFYLLKKMKKTQNIFININVETYKQQ